MLVRPRSRRGRCRPDRPGGGGTGNPGPRGGGRGLRPPSCSPPAEGWTAGPWPSIVFADVESRRRLEAITHPLILARMAGEVAALAGSDAPLVVVEHPLLFERGHQTEFPDGVLLVYADPATQLRRLRERGGLSDAAARQRLAAQLPIDGKRDLATWVIDNRGSRADTQKPSTPGGGSTSLRATRSRHDPTPPARMTPRQGPRRPRDITRLRSDPAARRWGRVTAMNRPSATGATSHSSVAELDEDPSARRPGAGWGAWFLLAVGVIGLGISVYLTTLHYAGVAAALQQRRRSSTARRCSRASTRSCPAPPSR